MADVKNTRGGEIARTQKAPPARQSTAAPLARLLIRLGRSHLPLDPAPRILDLRRLETVHIGRGAEERFPAAGHEGECRALLDDGWVSTEHARVTRQDRDGNSAFVIQDLGSTNSTMVNGRAVGRRTLRHGDIVTTGHSFWEYFQAPVQDLDGVIAQSFRGGEIRTDASACPTLLGERLVIDRVASTKIPLLLLGESGTGKEVMARMIHRRSRRPGPLVAINCAAIPAGLMESELFGHARGAFTGAVSAKRGLVPSADGGTLLLDEVGELPLPAQAKLLRLLQDETYFQVGDPQERRSDVRFIAATNADLGAMVAGDAFRSDLLARLDGITFGLPPLRERRSDLGILLASLLQRHAGGSEVNVSHDAYGALVMYRWPHNIRELDRVVETAVTLGAGHEEIGLEHLRGGILEDDGEVSSGATVRPADLGDDDLRDLLAGVLERNRGNIAAAAREIGCTRKQIHRWLNRLEMSPDRFRT